jgi:hypothetical protein
MKSLQPLCVFFFLLFFISAEAQSADDIISKHIQAIGGKDAWKKVTTLKQEGTVDVNGTKVDFAVAALNNKGYRQTVSFAGMSGYTIYTDSAGWNFYPWQGQMKPEAITAEDVKEAQDNLDVQGPLLDYKDKGHTVEYLGTDDFEGTDCYKLKLTEKSGKVITYYIDPSNYFIIHTVTLRKANGQETEAKLDFSNYRQMPEGIWLPMNINDGSSPLKIKKVEVNALVDNSLFKPAN